MRFQANLLATCSALVLSACNRYEWKPDYTVPEVCPHTPRLTEKPVRLDREISDIGGTIQGRVVRADSAAPVYSASVELSRAPVVRVLTDAQGHFGFESVPPGRYVLRIRGIGYHEWLDTVNVVSVARPLFEVALTPVATDGPCSGFASVRVRKPWWKIW